MNKFFKRTTQLTRIFGILQGVQIKYAGSLQYANDQEFYVVQHSKNQKDKVKFLRKIFLLSTRRAKKNCKEFAYSK